MTGVELLVGGWFASPVISSVVAKAQKFLGSNYELQKGTQALVDTLNRTLLLCQATVKEVENRAIINNPALTDWLRRLKLSVYDAEDVLDNLEAKSIKDKVHGKNMVSKLASSSFSGLKNLFSPDSNHKSLKNIVDLLNQIADDIPKILNLVNMNQNYESNSYEFLDNRETISIGLGYEHLDPCLRQCFAFCSVFPRNSIIEKERLIQIWMALNYIPQDNRGVSPEDVGRQWFDKLVEMSFFQLAGDDKGYAMPDLMHDLAVVVSSDECFYLDEESLKVPPGTRHLAVDTKNLEVVKGIQKYKHLRSFFYFGLCHVDGMYSTINETLCTLDSIRVLDLSYFEMETKEPPTAIQNLTHLRFLDLSSTGIEVLNSPIDHYHLQSLQIKKCQYLKLPKDINKLINLRHLNVDVEAIAQISGIGKLTNLQELVHYTVGKQEGHKVSELKNLREIKGRIKIDLCENIKSKDDAMQAKLADKKYLNFIEVCWSTWSRESNIDMEILEALKPHEHINGLTITGYMGSSFPDWVMQIRRFEHLQSLFLITCVRIKVLPPLGELPSLIYLHIDGLDNIKLIDHNLYGNKQTVFPALRNFTFVGKHCEKWTEAQSRYFIPSLTCLEFVSCFVMKEVPLHCFGASLKVLKIRECHGLLSLERSVNRLSCLTHLQISHTRVSIYLKFSDLMSLEELCLKDCPELSTAGDVQSLSSLKRLEITLCPKLLANSKYSIMTQLKGKGLQLHQGEGLRSLTFIDMDFLNEDYLHNLESLPALRILNYRNWQLSRFKEYPTLWFQQLTNLRELNFFNCEFEHIPSSLAKLEQLRKVMLVSCMKLESLPANGMPPFLWELTLVGCSQNLVQRCQPNDGEDWALISHIPLIRNNGRIIHNQQSSEGTSGKVLRYVL
jgi:Leucine-rich repeat (LRR) protein